MGITLFFGGTFNPPHLSHRKMLLIAEDIPNVERIIVAPTNIPPHKEVSENFADKEQRLNMCKLLTVDVSKAEVSDIEFNRVGKSYSFYTLSELKQRYGNIAMLIGGDMVTTFDSWFNFKGILEIAELYCVRRKGIDDINFDNSVNYLRSLGGKITVIDADLPNISSTEVRNCVNDDDKLKKLIPENIFDYIKKNSIYG